MSTFLTVLAIYLGPSALVFAWIAADRYFDNRAESKRRAEQGREVTPEWLALLAETEIDEDADLTYQQMCFEKWEAEL